LKEYSNEKNVQIILFFPTPGSLSNPAEAGERGTITLFTKTFHDGSARYLKLQGLPNNYKEQSQFNEWPEAPL
jgi:hypothetical protein